MKQTLNTLYLICAAFCMGLSFTSCVDSKGDTTTEQQLEGTWVISHVETDYEDGEAIKMKLEETITYELPSHRFKSYINMRIISPLNLNLCTITCEGKWMADRDALKEKVNSYDIEWHTSMLSSSDKKEFEEETLSDIYSEDICEIREISSNSLLVWNGEVELKYKRQ